MKVAAGSVDNLKPELVFSAIYSENGREFENIALNIQRLEIYGYLDEKLVPLEGFGEDIE